MSRVLRLLPILLLLLVVGALVWRLANPEDTVIRSRLTGAAVPDFVLPPALPSKSGLSAADLSTGSPRLLNIFASWCVPCVAEASVLKQLRSQDVAMDGIAVRDRPEDIAAFLAEHGDPFDRIGADQTSRVQLALGSAGVPESFVIDGRGVIRYQHVGPIMPQDLETVLGELEKAK